MAILGGVRALLDPRSLPGFIRQMLHARDLTCIRGERRLFSELGFALKSGEWLHVTGENGAGKTSLLRMLCGLASADAGEIRWNDTPIRELGDEYRSKLLYLGHQTPIKEELSARENLQVSSAVKGFDLSQDDADAALGRMGLSGREELPVRFLSQGQKRRVALAQLLTTEAPLWVLDEPFVALDAQAREVVTRIVAEHLSHGGVAVLTSHQDVSIGAGSKQALRVDA